MNANPDPPEWTEAGLDGKPTYEEVAAADDSVLPAYDALAAFFGACFGAAKPDVEIKPDGSRRYTWRWSLGGEGNSTGQTTIEGEAREQ
jgi:hypothetical protein